jgi:exosortase/archaeosortase family protein
MAVTTADPAGAAGRAERARGREGVYPTRLVLDGGTDDLGTGPAPPASSRTVVVRLVVLAAAVGVAYGRDLLALPAALGLDTPLAYASVAPLLAVMVGVAGMRVATAGVPRLPLRSGDKICGSALLALALLVAAKGPALFGFDAGPWRLQLASLPFFLAGTIWLLFGARVVWWLRHSLVLAALVAPVWYIWLVTSTIAASTLVTWGAVAAIASSAGFHTASVGGTNLVQIGDQYAAVSSVCSGASAMFGWVLAALTLSPLLAGRTRRKLSWVAAGTALAFVTNTARIVLILVAGRFVSADFALNQVHPWAGLLGVGLVTVIMLRSTARFGLQLRPVVATSSLRRLTVVAPVDWRATSAGVMAVALVIGVLGVGAWRQEPLGGRNGDENQPVAEQIGVTSTIDAGADRYRLVPFEPVPWASQYFGPGADWRRAGFFLAGTTGSTARAWLVSVDATTVADSARFEGFTLQACYGFHGYEVDHVGVTDLLVDRSAELLDYREPVAHTGTVVISWRQRVAGGRFERVVLSAVYGTDQASGESSDLADEATANAMVRELARVLSDRATLA